MQSKSFCLLFFYYFFNFFLVTSQNVRSTKQVKVATSTIPCHSCLAFLTNITLWTYPVQKWSQFGRDISSIYRREDQVSVGKAGGRWRQGV